MATDTIESLPATPLTVLSEEEQMFQQSVREFAIERVRPLVHDMDREATMSKELIATVLKGAEIEKRRVENIAEAEKARLTTEAEGRASAIRATPA